MEITKISTGGKKGWVKLYVDNRFVGLVSGEAVFLEKLKAGERISKEKLEKIKSGEEGRRFLEMAVNYLSYRPRSCWEVENFLKRKKATSKVIGKVEEKLKKLKLLNDGEFSRWFLEQRAKFRPRGLRAIRSELYKKRVDSKVIDEVLAEFEGGDFELGNARKMAEKFKKRKARLKGRDFRDKLYSYLAGLGFGYDTIKTVIDEMGQIG